ncbi:NAD(+) diphosphatase, partial [Patulibacter sp. S7RM1-6]
GMRGEAAPAASGRIGLREAAQTLGAADGGLVAYAAALLNWHRATRHCGVCGGPTAPGEGGMTRTCAACGTHHHPRADPVVIMLVADGDRVLLGRQRVWPARRYSTLAGFVSPGESLEEAVAREVLEETGVRVGTPIYHSSQPWPFPVSLMLGFVVPYADGELGGTDDELEDARWFAREEVRAAAALEDSWDAPSPGDGLLLPPRSAIARRLIESWALSPTA